MLCVVCAELDTQLLLCAPCARSLKQVEFSQGALIEWAARRARRFERRRIKKETPTP